MCAGSGGWSVEPSRHIDLLILSQILYICMSIYVLRVSDAEWYLGSFILIKCSLILFQPTKLFLNCFLPRSQIGVTSVWPVQGLLQKLCVNGLICWYQIFLWVGCWLAVITDGVGASIIKPWPAHRWILLYLLQCSPSPPILYTHFRFTVRWPHTVLTLNLTNKMLLTYWLGVGFSELSGLVYLTLLTHF